jgi:hypothetical protein
LTAIFAIEMDLNRSYSLVCSCEWFCSPFKLVAINSLLLEGFMQCVPYCGMQPWYVLVDFSPYGYERPLGHLSTLTAVFHGGTRWKVNLLEALVANPAAEAAIAEIPLR